MAILVEAFCGVECVRYVGSTVTGRCDALIKLARLPAWTSTMCLFRLGTTRGDVKCIVSNAMGLR